MRELDQSTSRDCSCPLARLLDSKGFHSEYYIIIETGWNLQFDYSRILNLYSSPCHMHFHPSCFTHQFKLLCKFSSNKSLIWTTINHCQTFHWNTCCISYFNLLNWNMRRPWCVDAYCPNFIDSSTRLTWTIWIKWRGFWIQGIWIHLFFME